MLNVLNLAAAPLPSLVDSVHVFARPIPSEEAKFWVSVLGFAGTIAALTFGAFQYRRAEKWRRAEFVAREIKEFESDPTIRNVLLLIDWSTRRINLTLDPELPKSAWPVITRGILWRALLPDSIQGKNPSWRGQPTGSTPGEGRSGTYSHTEALIRDAFDAFLDRLERFSNFTASSLVTAEEFRPFLRYWIDDIATVDKADDDAKWKCVLLTYIEFYGYAGVKELFRKFGYDIGPDGKIFQSLRAKMQDDELFLALEAEAKGGNSRT